MLGRLFARSLISTTKQSAERALTAEPQRFIDRCCLFAPARTFLSEGHARYPAPKIHRARSRQRCFQNCVENRSSHILRPSSERQVLCDCCPACREECAFEEDGDPGVWLKPVDCEEEDRSDKADPGNIKNGQRIGHPRGPVSIVLLIGSIVSPVGEKNGALSHHPLRVVAYLLADAIYSRWRRRQQCAVFSS
jgi:hypothetical protein